MAAWARQAKGGHGNRATAARQLRLLRPFTHWLQQFEPTIAVPDEAIFGAIPGRVAPHIYREQEIVELLAAARQLRPLGSLRAAVMETLFGLMACSGLRISEALALRNADVDLRSGVLTIRQSKFGKSRLVPLHSSAVVALARYRAQRGSHVHTTAETPFFVSTRGRLLGQPVSDRQAHRTFDQLLQQLGWIDRGGHGAPRVHDLRHNSKPPIIPSAASNDAALSEGFGSAGSDRCSELSEALQEIHNAVAGSVARYRDFLGSRIGQCSLLHLHVRVEIDRRGLG
jgi:integrase/recombinase XerC